MMSLMLQNGMLKRWRVHEPMQKDDQPLASHELARQLGVHPLIAKLLHQRQLVQPDRAHQFLRPRLTDLHDPLSLPDADRAAQRLAKAVREQQPIVVYGDYDVDGITASAILWHVLKLAGARVETYVPHRIDEGYGLNSQAIQQLAASKPVIVSVDCGITAQEPAQTAKQAGIDLIITDHHEMSSDPSQLPQAYALVHPRLPGSRYPFGQLCGAGVAFKLAWQFAKAHCGCDRLPAAFRELLLDLLALAALGTIADMVPLTDENRVITSHGLRRIKQTQFVGLNALIDASSLRHERIDTYHVGFVLGPRLNACGRMGHADKAVRLLTAAAPQEAAEIAQFLAKENDRRRSTEKAIFQEAKAMAVEHGYDHPDCRAIVLCKEDWHPGVLGIVASRMVEAFARPVVMLCNQNGLAQGSARSVPGLSIHEALCHCASLLQSFGGHAMAAGLKLPTQSTDSFRHELTQWVNQRLEPDDLVHVLNVDAACDLEEMDVALIEQIQLLAPFGSANPKPILCARAVTLDQPAHRVGRMGQHLKLTLRQGRRVASAVAFERGDWAEQLPAGTRLHVAFEPKVSTWQNRKRVEVVVKDICLDNPSSG